jgi:hypothetical protein
VEIASLIFRRCAELGSVRLLKEEFEAFGIKSKSWMSASGRPVGGKPFSRGALYQVVQNRIYRGETVHKEQSHPGQHTPIIDQPSWDSVQARLAANTAERNSGTRTRQPSLLGWHAVRRQRQSNDADPRDQERDAISLLCSPNADYQRADRTIRYPPHPSGGNRASGDQPHAAMACRSRQHLPGDTACRSVSAAR